MDEDSFVSVDIAATYSATSHGSRRRSRTSQRARRSESSYHKARFRRHAFVVTGASVMGARQARRPHMTSHISSVIAWESCPFSPDSRTGPCHRHTRTSSPVSTDATTRRLKRHPEAGSFANLLAQLAPCREIARYAQMARSFSCRLRIAEFVLRLELSILLWKHPYLDRGFSPASRDRAWHFVSRFHDDSFLTGCSMRQKRGNAS